MFLWAPVMMFFSQGFHCSRLIKRHYITTSWELMRGDTSPALTTNIWEGLGAAGCRACIVVREVALYGTSKSHSWSGCRRERTRVITRPNAPWCIGKWWKMESLVVCECLASLRRPRSQPLERGKEGWKEKGGVQQGEARGTGWQRHRVCFSLIIVHQSLVDFPWTYLLSTCASFFILTVTEMKTRGRNVCNYFLRRLFFSRIWGGKHFLAGLYLRRTWSCLQ